MIPQPSPWPRALATLLTGFILLVLSTTVFAWWEMGGVRLQPITVVAVSAGFNLPLVLGGIVVFIVGVAADLLSGGFVGLTLSALMLAFVVSAVVQRVLDLDTWVSGMFVVGLLNLLGQFAVIGGLVLAERSFLAPSNYWLILIVEAVLCALTAPVFFALLEKLTSLLARIMPAREGLGSV